MHWTKWWVWFEGYKPSSVQLKFKRFPFHLREAITIYLPTQTLLFELESRYFETATLPGTVTSRVLLDFVPYLVSLRLGFSMRRWLLFGRWALTPPFHHHPALCLQSAGLFIFCGTFRHAMLALTAFPCFTQGNLTRGARTFLPETSSGRWSTL